MKKIEVLGLQTIPEIKPGDNLAQIIVDCAKNEVGGLKEKDIIVLTSKIISKAMGLTRKLSEVTPGKKALYISKKTGKDPRWVQLIFDVGHQILAILPLRGIIKQQIMAASKETHCSDELIEHERIICITKSRQGSIHTCDAGIDSSNHPGDTVSLLPEDPDKAARDIREQIQNICGLKLSVILADTEMVPFGTMDLAVGSSGIEPRSKMFGKKDLFGKPKFGGMDLVANELTAASALLFGQVNAGIPAVVIRGYEYETSETENISNTLTPQGDSGIARIIKDTLRTTSYARGFTERLLLRIASWFV